MAHYRPQLIDDVVEDGSVLLGHRQRTLEHVVTVPVTEEGLGGGRFGGTYVSQISYVVML